MGQRAPDHGFLHAVGSKHRPFLDIDRLRRDGRFKLPGRVRCRFHTLGKNDVGGHERLAGLQVDHESAMLDITLLRMRALLAGAAQLAVSIEPPGGSPTGLPTGPVVIVAPISKSS